MINGFLSGCTVIIEQPHNRRVELALYCLPRALEAVWNMAIQDGYVGNVKYGEILLFSLSVGYLMKVYQSDQVSNRHP